MLLPVEGPHQCATLECRSPSGHGNTGLFCEPCAANLKRIREELEAAAPKSIETTTRGMQDPTCCNPYCLNSRIPPADFCEGCLEAGYESEDEAA